MTAPEIDPATALPCRCDCACGCCGCPGHRGPPVTDAERTALVAAVAGVPDTIDEVVATLERVAALTADWAPGAGRNGIACFNRLYLQITKDVRAGIRGGRFDSGPFIERLDVCFARRYLTALHEWAVAGPHTPGCWSILFVRREEDHHPWRFAATGVNAHVNFDLAFALLDTWSHPDEQPEDVGVHRADYDEINTIFAENMESLFEEFQAPFSVPRGTTWWEKAANIAADILVQGTRDVAWVFATRMWADRHLEGFRTGPEETLDLLATGLAKTLI